MKEYKGKISVIIPAFNEEQHIVENIKQILEVLDEAARDYEIVIVDDGSHDQTFEKALESCSHLGHVQVVRSPKNIGKGSALKYGFQFVSGDLVAFLDADLDLHPIHILTLFNFLKENNADVAIGSKRHPFSKLDYPASRKLMSNVYYYLIRMLFRLPIKDTQTGVKLFKYKVLEEVFPKVLAKKYAFDLELLANAHRLGYTIVEAPIVLNYQRQSRIRPRDIRVIMQDTAAIFYRMHILHYYDKKRANQKFKKIQNQEEKSKELIPSKK